MTLKEELLFLSEYFEGEERTYLERTSEINDDEKMKSVIYEAEQKLDARAVKSYPLFANLHKITIGG